MVIVASGIAVGHSVEAAGLLRASNLHVGVVNVVQQRALDSGLNALLVPGRPALTVYNGHPDLLRSAVAGIAMSTDVARPSVIDTIGFEAGTSGAPTQLFALFGMDAPGIANRVEKLLGIFP